MKFTSCFLILIFSVSCSPSQTITPVVEITSTTQSPRKPTFTTVPSTATIIPSIPPTNTALPCDPFTADFCITDGHFLLQRSIRLPANNVVDRTYPYASTADGTRDPHHGVEFVNESGTSVHAAADGVILFAGSDDEAVYSPRQNYYGNLVVIQHDNDLSTLYAHLSKIDVEAGDTVHAADKLGEVGRSGAAIGSHLHFEVRRGDAEDYFSAVNPELWLMPREPIFGALAISIVDANSTFQRAQITIQRYSSFNKVVGVYYLDTYHPTVEPGAENAGIGDLRTGRYRVTLIYNSRLYERWVEVQSNKLTQVVIVVK